MNAEGTGNSVHNTDFPISSSFCCLCSSRTWKEHRTHLLCSLNSSSYEARSGLCFDRVFPTHPSLRTLHAPLHHTHCIIPSNYSYLFRCLSPCPPAPPTPPTPTAPYSLYHMHPANKNNDSGAWCPQSLAESRCSVNV